MTTAQIGRKHYPALDGLRGAAILLVVVMHNFRFMNYFFFGWLGVDLFFVISGFLITDILLHTVEQPNYLRNFYLRRVLRIFPVYYLALIVCLFILPRIGSLHLRVDYYYNNQGWMWAYLQNWLFVFKEPYGTQMLLHTWSLGVEEQFYLFWPLVILLLRKPKRLLIFSLVLLIAVGIGRYLVWINHVRDLSYASLYTFTRIDGICIGSIIAILFRFRPTFLRQNRLLIVLLAAAVNFAFYFINGRRGFTLPYLAFVGYTTFALLFGLLLYEAVIDDSKIIRAVFTNRVLKFFGKISYGFYVYHWPLYIILFPLSLSLLRKSLTEFQAEVAGSLLVTLVAILISYASYRFFEKPLLRLKEKLG